MSNKPTQSYISSPIECNLLIMLERERKQLLWALWIREVTLIHLLFTNCRISMVLPDGCVTLKGGKPKGTREHG
jgi:hypothetical protein